MQTGLKISLGGHGALILLALLGWPFASDDAAQAPEAVNVTLVSAEQIQTGRAAPETPTPPAPTPPAPPPPAPKPAAPEPAPPPPVPETPPVPEPPAPPQPEAPPPPKLDRVAPVPQPVLPKDLPEAETRQEAVTASPDPAPKAPEVEEQRAAAPKAALPEIATEAAEPERNALNAPPPRPRPERPQPVAPPPDPQPQVQPKPEPEPTPDPAPAADPLAEALAEAMSAPDAPADAPAAPAAPVASGPPLTMGEQDGLRVAVGQCWNFSALGTDAAKVTVIVGMDMTLDGVPSNLRLLSFNGGSEAAAQQAYETARRAILRCQPYDLPPEKFDHWRKIEMTFNPERMRSK